MRRRRVGEGADVGPVRSELDHVREGNQRIVLGEVKQSGILRFSRIHRRFPTVIADRTCDAADAIA